MKPQIMNRSLSSFGLLLTSIAGMVGSGWLLGPLFTAQFAGPAATIAWPIGGFLILFIAFVYAENTAAVPVTGCLARLPMATHGTLASFITSWLAWLAMVIVAPIEANAIIQYASNYLPGMIYSDSGTHSLTHLGMFIAAVILLLMCTINYFGIKAMSKSTNVIMLSKLGVPLLTVTILLYTNMDTHTSYIPYGGFMAMGWHGVFQSLSMGGVVLSFIGFQQAILLAGEAKNPNKAIPFALIGSVLVAILLYSLIQFAFITSLKPDDLANGWAHLSFKGDLGPFAGLASAAGFAWLAIILYADAAFSPFGTGLVYTASTSRLVFAMSRNGYTPKTLMHLNQHHSPVMAIALNFIVGFIMYFPMPGWKQMSGFFVACSILAYTMGPLSLSALRKQVPDLKRPFRIRVHHLICIIAFFICNMLIYWTGWQTIIMVDIALVLGIIFLIIYHKTERGKQLKIDWVAAYWCVPYFILMSLTSHYGSFGGQGKISTWSAFAVIFMITILIYALALKLRIKQSEAKLRIEILMREALQ